MWFEIIPPYLIITAGVGLPGAALWWIHYLTLGNHYRRSLHTRWDRRAYQRDLRLTGNPYQVSLHRNARNARMTYKRTRKPRLDLPIPSFPGRLDLPDEHIYLTDVGFMKAEQKILELSRTPNNVIAFRFPYHLRIPQDKVFKLNRLKNLSEEEYRIERESVGQLS